MIRWQAAVAAHVGVHILDPQSLSYGPHDSPAALAAWLLNRRYHYSDCGGRLENSFSRDDLCTLLTLYWASESFVTSVRYYREAALSGWQPSHDRVPIVQAPTGVSHFTLDVPPEVLSEEIIRLNYNLVYYRRHDTGGHFAAAESPDAVARDIRATVQRAAEDRSDKVAP
jgi:pimeloyl-ACP methyl ester carboxylesterase